MPHSFYAVALDSPPGGIARESSSFAFKADCLSKGKDDNYKILQEVETPFRIIY